MGSAYLVSLSLRHLDILVVGGGEVALRKVVGLTEAPGSLTVVAPEVRRELAEFVEELGSKASIQMRSFDPSDLAGRQAVFAATSDAKLNSEISKLCRAGGLLVNNVSDPAESTFTNVAVAKKGELSIGVSTGSRAPGFSKAISRLIEEMLPAEIGSLLVLAAEVRSQAVNSGRSAGALNWERVLDSEVLEFIRAGKMLEAQESLSECLS